MRDDGYKASGISRAVMRSRKAVYFIFHYPGKENMAPRPGHPPIISPISERHLIREARMQEMNARQIKAFVNAPVSVERRHQYLKSVPRLSWQRMNRHVSRTPLHKQGRLESANQRVDWKTEN